MEVIGVGVDVDVDAGQENNRRRGEAKQIVLHIYVTESAFINAPHVRMCCVSFSKYEAKIESVQLLNEVLVRS